MLKQLPPSDYCRLCVKSCNDTQRILYDETDQANSNHDLVAKYFTNAMLNMEWERRLQYICKKCWQHIWEFHQFQQSVIEAQKGLHLHTEASKEVDEVKIKPEVNINQQEEQLELHNAKGFSTSSGDLMQSTVLTFDIKTEEPLDLNSDNDEMSSHGSQLTDDEVSLINTSLTNDIESYEDFSSNDDMPLSSLSHNNLSTSESKFATTKRSVEQFDELVALWRSSLECEICHQLVASYSQLEEHFGKNHASEICYLMCCQLKLESRYDIERHIYYHNAPQRLKCEACCKAYRLEKHLITHKRKVHTSKGGGKNTNYRKKLEGRYRCSKCLKKFATTTSLSAHNRNVHKPKIFECNMCEKSFRRPNALRQHLAVHEGERKHACSVCSKTFTCRAYFCRHMRIYHPQEWKKMQNVKFQTKTRKGYLLVTQGESMVYVCIYCSVEYSKQQSIYSHLKRCRRDGTPIQPKRMYRLVTRGESVVYVCIYCSKEYANRRSMNSHLYRRHRDDRSSAKRASIISEPPEPSEQQQDSLCTTRIIDPKATDVTNITPDGDTFNMPGKVQEEDSLMAPVEGKELKDENATRIYVKTEQISADTNALGNEEIGDNEMPLEFEDTTWECEEFIKSEEEFIELQAET